MSWKNTWNNILSSRTMSTYIFLTWTLDEYRTCVLWFNTKVTYYNNSDPISRFLQKLVADTISEASGCTMGDASCCLRVMTGRNAWMESYCGASRESRCGMSKEASIWQKLQQCWPPQSTARRDTQWNLWLQRSNEFACSQNTAKAWLVH